MNDPLAYHITWTTYGTWLPGDSRGWIKSGESGIKEPDESLRREARSLMTQEPVFLDETQRAIVDRTIREVIAFRMWTLHALNVRTNHIHIVLTAARDPETVMEQLKAWCSRRLNEHVGRKQKWWTEHGSTKWINDDTYFANAVRYVTEGQ